ncbi:WG repeat-containing protein [Micromonospora sp. NPDC049497]|uniref:WG repeat-containing protein n=1 Tax=Micromonospora sp. NPDC049497 TaxID=3364273 RepID=UPI0037A005BF
MSRGYADRWHDPAEPSWMAEPTNEWHPQFPGQRYAGDIGVHHVPPPAPRGRAAVVGRAEVPPLAPTRPDGTYVGRSWDDDPEGRAARHDGTAARHDGQPNRHDSRSGRSDDNGGRRYPDEPYRRTHAEPTWSDDRHRQPEAEPRNGRSGPDRSAPARPVDEHRPREHGRERHAARHEPVGRDRPVSPAGRTEAGWVPEPDEDRPRRHEGYERPENGHGRRPGEEPQRTRYPWGRADAERRDRSPDARWDRAPDARRERGPESHADRTPDGQWDRGADGSRDRSAPAPDRAARGQWAAPADRQWERPVGGQRDRAGEAGVPVDHRSRPDRDRPGRPHHDGEQRRPDPEERRRRQEAAGRAETYPDRRPPDTVRPEPYREPEPHRDPRGYADSPAHDGGLPWPPPGPVRPAYDGNTPRRGEPRPEHRRPAEPVDRSRHGSRHDAPPHRYDERPHGPGTRTPGTPVSPAPVSGAPVSPAPARGGSTVPPAAPHRPVSPAPVSGPPAAPHRPVSPAPVSGPPAVPDRPVSPAARTPVSGPPVDAGRRPPPGADDRFPHQRHGAEAAEPVDEPSPVSGPPAARLRVEFRPAPVVASPADDMPAPVELPRAGATGTSAAPTAERPAPIGPGMPRPYVPPPPSTPLPPPPTTTPPGTGVDAWFRPARPTTEEPEESVRPDEPTAEPSTRAPVEDASATPAPSSAAVEPVSAPPLSATVEPAADTLGVPVSAPPDDATPDRSPHRDDHGGRPVSGPPATPPPAPVSAPPARPTSGPPWTVDPVSGPPDGSAYPVSGAPWVTDTDDLAGLVPPPPAGPFTSAYPVSGAPWAATTGEPAPARPDSAPPVAPVSAPPAWPEPGRPALSFSGSPEDTATDDAVGAPPPRPVSAPPSPPVPSNTPVSGPPHAPVSAPPHVPAPAAPWSADHAAHAAHVSAPAVPVSAAPATEPAAPPEETTTPVRPVSAPPGAPVPAPPAAPPAPVENAWPVPEAPAEHALAVPATPAENVPADPTPPRSAAPEVSPVESVTGRPDLSQGDPEQVLASYRWRLDPATLREVVEEPDQFRVVRRRLTEKLGTAVDNRSRARLLSLRAVVSRIVGDLDDALADGRLALTYAEATGELRRTSLAQARLAHVLRWRGDFAEADRLFAQANSDELPDRLRAALHEHAGRCCYEQGRLMEACHHFERALDLRGAGDPELLARIRFSLDAVAERATEIGFGPYPRGRDEVLERVRPPVPALDGDRWGYADSDGEMVVPGRYAEAQPFRDGVAWARPVDNERWALIDLTGETVLPPTYLVVRPFSDGLAWVSQGEPGGWGAVDTTGEVAVPPGFAEVRPFRRGLAAVRREGWGAVDRTGRVVVPTRYHGFATTLADGRYVDGFTDEGLAVVDVAGRRGVVDRTGKLLVPPVHPVLVVHPVAFLAGDGTGRWGALDRQGGPLIDPVHRNPDDVVVEIERLLTDTNPVL